MSVIARLARTNGDFPPDFTRITSEVFRVALVLFPCTLSPLFCLSIFYVSSLDSAAGVRVVRTAARPVGVL